MSIPQSAERKRCPEEEEGSEHWTDEWRIHDRRVRKGWKEVERGGDMQRRNLKEESHMPHVTCAYRAEVELVGG